MLLRPQFHEEPQYSFLCYSRNRSKPLCTLIQSIYQCWRSLSGIGGASFEGPGVVCELRSVKLMILAFVLCWPSIDWWCLLIIIKKSWNVKLLLGQVNEYALHFYFLFQMNIWRKSQVCFSGCPELYELVELQEIMNENSQRASSGSSGSTGSRGHAENIKKVAVTMPSMNALFMELDQVSNISSQTRADSYVHISYIVIRLKTPCFLNLQSRTLDHMSLTKPGPVN